MVNLLVGSSQLDRIQLPNGLSVILSPEFQNCKLSSYQNYDKTQICGKLPVQLQKAYVEMWEKFSVEKQRELISCSVAELKKYDASVFKDNALEIKSKGSNNFNKLTLNERMLKLLLTMNSSDFELTTDIEAKLVDCLIEMRNSKGNTNFISSAVLQNVKEAMTIEHFVLNLLVQKLDNIYFKEVRLKEILSEETSVRKNKKRKRKKKPQEQKKCHSSYNEIGAINFQKSQKIKSEHDCSGEQNSIYKKTKTPMLMSEKKNSKEDKSEKLETEKVHSLCEIQRS